MCLMWSLLNTSLKNQSAQEETVNDVEIRERNKLGSAGRFVCTIAGVDLSSFFSSQQQQKTTSQP